MKRKLEDLKKNKKAASFYTDENNTSKFLFGYIVDYNDDFFIVAMISPDGQYDGFVLREISSIVRINVDGKYENKILELAKHNKIIHEKFTLQDDNFISEFLRFAEQQEYIVSIELLNSGFYDVQGYIEAIEDDNCNIKQVNEYGEEDGVSLIKLIDITKISCNSLDEKVLKVLSTVRK
ncbi:hypothetical protein [Clostridium sp. YIM B02551]|uniref:hypothetical protein n=1 Tax=Clostridium sp. YIM B02551 TaxID=2910679 RepID=UPI001EEB980D|nr:hypothetical protein [Clostridium sp. YIM B02551]